MKKNFAFEIALQRWQGVLPHRAIRLTSTELLAASAATYASTRSVRAILIPETTAEVSAILVIASQTGCPIYPYSRGKNWGLGSRLPAEDHCVLLDLSAMDRILDYDPVMGTITVEPGVHFAQVASFLAEKKSPFYGSVTGSSPYGSLIGNALDRGRGDGPLGHRFANMANLELVLATGEVIRTGYGRFQNASTAKLVKEGVGMSILELLGQSNLGVVTQATFWLHRQPAERAHLLLKFQSLDDLATGMDDIRTLLQMDVLYPHAIFVWNAFKVLAASPRPPSAAISASDAADRSGHGVAPWSATIRVHAASSKLLEATIDSVREALNKPQRDWSELRKGDVSEELWRQIEPGNPTGINVLSTYWRKQGPPPEAEDLDPDRDRCGVLWVCPSLPMDGNVICSVLMNVETMIIDYGFEPNIGFNPVSPRAAEIYISIMYDMDEPGQDIKAMLCHNSVMDWLIAQGHLPYRLGIHSMQMLPKAADHSDMVFDRIRKAFDPTQVVSPGRYA